MRGRTPNTGLEHMRDAALDVKANASQVLEQALFLQNLFDFRHTVPAREIQEEFDKLLLMADRMDKNTKTLVQFTDPVCALPVEPERELVAA